MDRAVEAAGTPLRLEVDGMDCAGCARKIEAALGRMEGVGEVRASVPTGAVSVAGVLDAERRDEIVRTLGKLGYPVREPAAGSPSPSGRSREHAAPAKAAWWRTPAARPLVPGALLLAAGLAASLLFPALGGWAWLPAAMVGLVPVARRALAAARAGVPFTIEMLMTIAALGAVAIGAVSEAAIVVFLFAAGELLEGVAADRARRGIQALAELAPRTARLVEEGGVREVPAETLLPGQRVLVRPGDRVPADGTVREGSSSIDEAPVTGESVPRGKGAGARVFAGTVNLDGVLEVEVERSGGDNTIARIVRLVEEAQEARAPTERFIDRFSRWYMPAVVAVALMTAVLPPLLAGAAWGEWLYRALALLLIACPCALVISTPAAIAAGLAAGARRGLLMKGGVVLESLAGIRTMALDKTGTLTRGRPQLTDIVAAGGVEEERALALAAALEQGSGHPVGVAILEAAAARGLPFAPLRESRALPGRGIEGTVGGRVLRLVRPGDTSLVLDPGLAGAAAALEADGKTVSVLAGTEGVLALLAVRDEPREEAHDGLRALERLGVRPVMLTGDSPAVAESVAGRLGIEARAGLMPEDKARIVGELAAHGPVAKVGDGINDAPALAAASVGIAMGSGTDVALETADAALLRNDLRGLAELVALARATLANVRQNVAAALGLKAVFLVTSIAGVTGLWPAIMADTGATVLVTMNALRLLRLGRGPAA
ncbi:heavy metal translocating P-type ATPase [Marinimicrococcus flavescens]|uniref:P-type Zn(2+) transporter n=1 Tax=Marinimicrococcus flavescens TaxID=3031815 RepID=A0AAP3UZJ6_9PROT|nr:heavy metal translocating P-type ATPase [Marinimicrococcus flavescens]